MSTRHLKYAAGAVGVIAGAAIAGFGSGIGSSYGRHLMESGKLPLPGAPRAPRQRPQGRLSSHSGEEALVNHLKMLACFRQQSGGKLPKGWTYNSTDDFVLDRGKFYRKSEPLTEKEWAILDRALGGRQCRQKECYYNAQLLAAFDPSKKLKYTEGYAVKAGIPIPIHHAWVTLNGKIIDLTWRAQPEESPTHRGKRLRNRVLGVIPPGWVYLGVEFPTNKIRDRLLSDKMSRNVIGDWQGDHREFKWKRKGELDCTGFEMPHGGRASRSAWKRAPGKQNPRVAKHFKTYIIVFDHPTKADYEWTAKGALKPGRLIRKVREFSSASQATAVLQNEVLDYILDWKPDFGPYIKGWTQVGKSPQGSQALTRRDHRRHRR